MKPAYTVNAKGVISIDYPLFKMLDPYEVAAACRGNLRGGLVARTPIAQTEVLTIGLTVGQR